MSMSGTTGNVFCDFNIDQLFTEYLQNELWGYVRWIQQDKCAGWTKAFHIEAFLKFTGAFIYAVIKKRTFVNAVINKKNYKTTMEWPKRLPKHQNKNGQFKNNNIL